MADNIVNRFFEFKYQSALRCCDILYPPAWNPTLQKTAIQRYLRTYFDTYYYHILGTLDDETTNRYGYETICRELDGISFELIHQLENAEVLDDIDTYRQNRIVIERSYRVSLLAALLDLNDYSDCYQRSEIYQETEDIIHLYPEFTEQDSKHKIDSITDQIVTRLQQEERFLTAISSDTFCLDYTPYRYNNRYLVPSLKYSIKKVSRNYRKRTIEKVLSSDVVAYGKVQTIFHLLNVDLLSQILSGKELDLYFVSISDSVLADKQEWLLLLKKIENPVLKKQIVLTLDYNTYTRRKSMLENLEGEFQFAVLSDMSHINDIDKRMTTLENISLFRYIILDKVKDKDLKLAREYIPISGKILFLNEFQES